MTDKIYVNTLQTDEEKAKATLADAVVEAKALLASVEREKARIGRNGDVQLLNFKIDNLTEEVKKINDKLENHYVTEDQFKPVKNVVYGMVGLILSGVLVAVISLIIIK
jgi:uncharacterized membrane protein YkoI